MAYLLTKASRRVDFNISIRDGEAGCGNELL